MSIKTKEVSFSLPFGIGSVKLVANEAEQRAAWALYFEFSTRISQRTFDKQNSRLRAVLNSLHALFKITRDTLREAGPDVAHGPKSLGPLAIDILNKGLAPYTTRWHNQLESYEEKRPEHCSRFEHERSWEYFEEAVNELENLQSELSVYIIALGKISGAAVSKE